LGLVHPHGQSDIFSPENQKNTSLQKEDIRRLEILKKIVRDIKVLKLKRGAQDMHLIRWNARLIWNPHLKFTLMNLENFQSLETQTRVLYWESHSEVSKRGAFQACV